MRSSLSLNLGPPTYRESLHILNPMLVTSTFPVVVSVASVAAQPGIIKSEFLFETAPFAHCHASTIVESGGQLLCAFFGGTAEGHRDVGIWLSRYENGLWRPPVEVADGVDSKGTRFPCWNPVLFQPRTGPLLLFYKVGHHPDSWWGMVKTSEDHGATWSAPQRLPRGVLGPIKNKPIELEDSTILAPSSSEKGHWRVHFERSNDGGRTWKIAKPIFRKRKIGSIQPSILSYGGDRMEAVGRTQAGRIFQTWSEDSGKTWGPLTLTALPNPNSGTDAVTLADGRQLMVYNHTSHGRTPLNVALSNDGVTWSAALILEDGRGEFSYPAVIQTTDGLVHITYTWKRLRIKHVVIDPVKLQCRPILNGKWPN